MRKAALITAYGTQRFGLVAVIGLGRQIYCRLDPAITEMG